MKKSTKTYLRKVAVQENIIKRQEAKTTRNVALYENEKHSPSIQHLLNIIRQQD